MSVRKMIKVKTFTFEDNAIFKYDVYGTDIEKGEWLYKPYIDKIDDTINKFLEENEFIEIVDIKINSIVKGNNPPTSILIYTILYRECKYYE